MKKRLKDKKRKKEMIKLLSQILNKFKVTNLVFGSGYFIFSFGKNSVCHFDIENIRYGIWYTENGIEIFGEHKGFIDKFKPSAVALTFDDVNELIKFQENLKTSYEQVLGEIYECTNFLEEEKEALQSKEDFYKRNGFTTLEWYKLTKEGKEYLNELIKDPRIRSESTRLNSSHITRSRMPSTA